MDSEKTVVIFRTWRHDPQRGHCVAIFPEVATDDRGYECQMYAHVGQHFSGLPNQVIANTQPAGPLATALLRWELETEPYGYRLIERKRVTAAMNRARLAMAAEYRAMLAREHERSGELDIGESAY